MSRYELLVRLPIREGCPKVLSSRYPADARSTAAAPHVLRVSRYPPDAGRAG